MITTLTGVPGSGKSLFGVRLCVESLRRSGRGVVTNLPLRTDEFRAFCQEQKIDSENRVRLLDHSEVPKFYKIRVLSCPDRSRPWMQADLGVLYIIDEAATYFNARKWSTFGDDLADYLRHHRKKNDEIIFITQAGNFIDSTIRELTEEWATCENWRNRSVAKFGLRVAPESGFVIKRYFGMPSAKSQPYETVRYDLPKGLADCYDTTAGAGIIGTGKPEERPQAKRLKGWQFLIIVVLVLVVGFSVVVFGGASLIKGLLGKALGQGQELVNVGVPAAKPAQPVQAPPRAEKPSDLAVPRVSGSYRDAQGEWVSVGGQWVRVKSGLDFTASSVRDGEQKGGETK